MFVKYHNETEKMDPKTVGSSCGRGFCLTSGEHALDKYGSKSPNPCQPVGL